MHNLILPNDREITCIDEITAKFCYNEIFVDNVYLQKEIQIKNNSTIFDIGANIGLFTIYANEQAKNLSIYSFEPIPVIYEVLEKNIDRIKSEYTKRDNNIELFNFGLGEKNEEIVFNYYPNVCADSAAIGFDWDFKIAKYVENYNERICQDMPIAKIVPKFLRKYVVKAGLKRVYKAEKVNGEIRTISSFIEEHNIHKIDLLKIDAENYEKNVLSGINEADWDKIQQITMEVHTHIKGGKNLLKEIMHLLERKGFENKLGEEDIWTKMGVFMLYSKR